MAATTLASGTSSVATTTVSFSAQPAGTLMVLTVTASDLLATSGTGRPESTGWTKGPNGADWVEVAMYALVATGGETSVQYKIGSANPSAYNLVAYDNGFVASPLGGATSSLHSHNDTTGIATPGTTAITPASGSSWLVVASFGGSRESSSSFSNPSSFTNGYTRQSSAICTTPDTYANNQGYAVVTGGSATSTAASWASGAAKCNYGQLWAFEIAAGGGSNAGTLDATLPKLTGAISGQSVNSGTLDAATPRVTASITAQSVNPATLAASLPRVAAAIAGASVNPGTLDAQIPRITATISDTTANVGSLAASLPRVTANIAGQSVNPATLNAALPKMSSAVSGTQVNPAALAVAVPRVSASVVGQSVNPGALAAVLPRVTAQLGDIVYEPFPATRRLTVNVPTGTVVLSSPDRRLDVGSPLRTLDWST